MKQRKDFPLLIALTGISLSSFANGQLFSDDFENSTVDAGLTTSGPWGFSSIQTADITVRDESTSTPFGTPNQYLDFNDNDGSSVRVQSPELA